MKDDDQRLRGSSSPAKKIEARRRISLSSSSRRTSAFSSRISASSSLVGPWRYPLSIWAWRTPAADRLLADLLPATTSTAPISDGYSGRCSRTCRTHRALSSLSILFGMDRILPTQKDAASNLGRFNQGRGARDPAPVASGSLQRPQGQERPVPVPQRRVISVPAGSNDLDADDGRLRPPYGGSKLTSILSIWSSVSIHRSRCVAGPAPSPTGLEAIDETKDRQDHERCFPKTRDGSNSSGIQEAGTDIRDTLRSVTPVPHDSI